MTLLGFKPFWGVSHHERLLHTGFANYWYSGASLNTVHLSIYVTKRYLDQPLPIARRIRRAPIQHSMASSRIIAHKATRVSRSPLVAPSMRANSSRTLWLSIGLRTL
jgi:hypothetical protein